MGDEPVKINPIGNLINLVISGLANNVAAPVLEGLIEAEVPFLAFPVIKQIFEYLFGYLIGKLSIVAQDGAITLVFNIQTSQELKGTVQSLLDLQKAQEAGDEARIKEATDKAAEAWSKLIYFDGIAPHHG